MALKFFYKADYDRIDSAVAGINRFVPVVGGLKADPKYEVPDLLEGLVRNPLHFDGL